MRSEEAGRASVTLDLRASELVRGRTETRPVPIPVARRDAVQQLVERSTAASGVPLKVEDPSILRRVAAMFIECDL